MEAQEVKVGIVFVGYVLPLTMESPTSSQALAPSLAPPLPLGESSRPYDCSIC